MMGMDAVAGFAANAAAEPPHAMTTETGRGTRSAAGGQRI
jgi:hypothetical protein